MKFSIVSVMFLVASASARHEYGSDSLPKWHPAGPGDFRGPCPMMNTLANHGFLPHDGRNLTEETVVGALKRGINFDEALGKIMFEQALVANPEPNATFFTLHNVLEHDASMSRLDAYFGNNHVFNQKVFDTTKAYWTGETMDAKMLANGKLFRQIESRSTNPKYTFTNKTEAFSLGEVSAPIIVFGDLESGTVSRKFVEYFFGWSKKKSPVSFEQITAMSDLIRNATNLLTNGKAVGSKHRRDLHAGLV
ncbi:hypothetical protein ACHAPJ_011984 [Fusarium lateritium]